MARELVGIIPALVILYGTFLLGQVNMKRKFKDRRDPLPVIHAARNVIAAANMGGAAPANLKTQIGLMELAIDEWDLKPTN